MLPASVKADDLASVVEFISAARSGIVATVTAVGRPEAAFVGLAILDDATLIFNTHEDARKIANLRASEHVAVVVGTAGAVTIQIEGVARIVEGDERESYGAEYIRQRPGSRARSTGFSVVVIQPTWIRVYDTTTHTPTVTEATMLRTVKPVAAEPHSA
ncbi:pyridoxamine 5'-phosphate oxidase family protein [Leifsonia sp. A12D58]|uniref:pyridoxamine 5'-phosphate oxidase family protein n=1 Tax=Leifsonia sp. A12D58 TaxID=3397674 RepID=UPI0039E0E41D